MKSSTKSSGFCELNNALKALKKGQNIQKGSQQIQQNHLFLRSSSQASNVLLMAASSNTNTNSDIFSQRNSNANLKIQLNSSNKLQKKSSQDHIKRSSIDQSRNKQSPLISSPRIIENSEANGCQTSGRKSQYLNNSNLSGNSTSLGNTKQIIGQIKISLAKSKSKTNFSTLSNSQADLQIGGCAQNSKQNDQGQMRSTMKGDQYKMSRTQSKAKIISPMKQQQTLQNDKTFMSNKKISSQKQIKSRYVENSQESDRYGINVSEEEENAHYNDKENLHSNIQMLTNQKKSNSQKKLDQQKQIQDSLNKKRDSQKLTNSIQQPLMKKKSDGQIENRIPNQLSQKNLQLIQNTEETSENNQSNIKNSNNNYNNPLHQNSIQNILGRAKSQDKIIFDREQIQEQIQQSTQEQQNALGNSGSSQSQQSMTMMMMILANSNYANINNNQNNSFNNNTSKSLKKSNSKSSLHSQKTLTQQNSKLTLSQTRLVNTSNQNTQLVQSQHKQNNSISYLKINSNNSGNLSKSNSSLLKNNHLNFSRGHLETLTDNTNILLSDNSFTNTNYNQINNFKNQQIQSQINSQSNQTNPTNSFYRIASTSSINGKTIQTPARDHLDHQIGCFQDSIQQNLHSTQILQNSQQGELIKKISVDEYKKTNCLQSNKNRNQEQQKEYQQKNILNTTSGLSGQTISHTMLHNNTNNNISIYNQNQCQNTSNYNVILNTQCDTQDASSFFKYPNNYNFLLDCKSDTSSGQLGCSSTQKRMLNSSSNRLNTSQHPTVQQNQIQNQVNQQQQQLQQINNQSTPQRKNSAPYIVEKQQSNSSFSSTQQSGFLPTQAALSNNNFNGNNNQNILVSQYVQSFNAMRTATQQSDTNFTFQNNSQNPLSFAIQPNTQIEYQVIEQKEEDLKQSKIKNMNNSQQNQQQTLDKYATSSFKIKTQEDEQLNETINRRSSQQIQQQQNLANLNNSNQKPFSILFNNLFSTKCNSKKNIEESSLQQSRQNKSVRKNSNSLVSQNLTNKNMQTNPKTDNSPSDHKRDGFIENHQVQQTQNYIDSLIAQRNSQGFLPQEVAEKYKYKRTPSLTQFNFSNQYNLQLVQPQSNKNASFEAQNIHLFNSKTNIKQTEISPLQNIDIEKELEQYKQPQQKLSLSQSFQQQKQQNSQITNPQNQMVQNNQNLNQQQLQQQMQILHNKMKQKLQQFKTCEQQWKNEKSKLIYQVESLQNQVNFLTEENSLYKKSVASYYQQNEKHLNTSLTSSMEAVLQNF